ATDTFFWRAGDTLSAVLVGVGVHQLGFGARQFAITNLVLITGWIAIAIGIAHRHRTISGESKPRPPRRRRGRILTPAGAHA
ncbi:MAG TPA: hypothetical protein VIV11_38900, partial [Kofleriaceae bacterium]